MTTTYPIAPLIPSLKDVTKSLEKEIENNFEILSEIEIKKQFKEKLFDWKNEIKYTILRENPYLPFEDSLITSEKSIDNQIPTLQHLTEYLQNIRQLSEQSRSPFQFDYYEKEIAKLEKESENIKRLKNDISFGKENQKQNNNLNSFKIISEKKTKNLENKKKNWQKEVSILQKLLIEKWREFFDQILSEWELQKLKELREIFLKQVKQWLKLLQELKKTCDELSMESGFLWDLSKGSLSSTNIELLKKWVNYIKDSKGIKELCDLMGRIKRYEKSKRQETIKKTTHIKHLIPDNDSKEEIVGLTFGRDLENILSSEMSLLADKETSLLFDIKFVENRLMCFKMEGLSPFDKEFQENKKITIEEENPGGPIIICVDTSSSMEGTPENIAKALTLILTSQAFSQKRECLLINFSTSIKTIEFTKEMEMNKLFNFLQESFGGGTDVAPAFEYSLKKMESEKFSQADLLIISDFIMGDLSKNIVNKIIAMKEKKNRFFSLCIGDISFNKKISDIFDGEWIYNPRSMDIEVFKKIKDKIEKS